MNVMHTQNFSQFHFFQPQIRLFGKKTKQVKNEKISKEKEQIKGEFAEVDTDDIKQDFQDSLDQVVELL